jgi:hypothetical protein
MADLGIDEDRRLESEDLRLESLRDLSISFK